MDNIVDRFYYEEVYTLADLANLFTAIHEGKIKTVVIENMGKRLEFDVSTIVQCKKCKYFQKGIPIVNMCMLGHSPCCIDFFCADGKLKEGVHE